MHLNKVIRPQFCAKRQNVILLPTMINNEQYIYAKMALCLLHLKLTIQLSDNVKESNLKGATEPYSFALMEVTAKPKLLIGFCKLQIGLLLIYMHIENI